MHDLSRLLHSLSETSVGGAFDKPRVLVADDDPLTSRLLTSLSKNERFQVTPVSDGREAYRMLKSDADFKAAVFNITLPNLEGVELVRYMKTEKRLMRIPVVAIGNAHDLKGMAQSFAAGAVAFLSKPFIADQLLRAVRIALSSERSEKFQHAT